MSHPILEIVKGAVVVVDRKWMSAVTESPIKASVCLAKRAESEGVSRFFGVLRNDFGIGDEGGCVLLWCKNVCVGGAVGHLSGISR